MAVFKIFPEKDAFIYTEAITGNTGLDPILELGGYPISDLGQAQRILLQFPSSKLTEVIDDVAQTTNIQASIHLSLAAAYELTAGYSVYAYPVYESWTNGVGRFGDSPVDDSGVSWAFRHPDQTGRWTTDQSGVVPANVSYYYGPQTAGGGNWYTSYNGDSLESIKTQSLNSTHDLDIDVTAATLLHYGGSIVNNGFILKLSDDVEFNTSTYTKLKFYGADTNTIYPPHLEVKWDDSIYNPGTLSTLSTSNAVISVTNNRGVYSEEGRQRFRLSAKPKHPTRTFTTSSIYLTNYALPQESYWAIKDENTEELVVNFDSNYTKISCDSDGPYFDVYMDGLQPERYYRILIKTVIDGSTVVVDDRNIFKVVQNV